MDGQIGLSFLPGLPLIVLREKMDPAQGQWRCPFLGLNGIVIKKPRRKPMGKGLPLPSVWAYDMVHNGFDKKKIEQDLSVYHKKSILRLMRRTHK